MKKQYMKPSLEVVKLQQKEALLQSSVNATMTHEWTEEDI